VTELCAGCHDASTFPELDQHRAEEGEDCVECHDPHAAPRPYMLTSENPRTPLVPVAMPVALQRAGR
jgi:predicted CXXCH cytochrome family protein